MHVTTITRKQTMSVDIRIARHMNETESKAKSKLCEICLCYHACFPHLVSLSFRNASFSRDIFSAHEQRTRTDTPLEAYLRISIRVLDG